MSPRTINVSPAITPFAADLLVDEDRLVAHAPARLAAGAHSAAPFGTTAEASSLSVVKRMSALEAPIAGGSAPRTLIPGTGRGAAAGTIALSAPAMRSGGRGGLMPPPFCDKGVSWDGVSNAFSQVIDMMGDAGVDAGGGAQAQARLSLPHSADAGRGDHA